MLIPLHMTCPICHCISICGLSITFQYGYVMTSPCMSNMTSVQWIMLRRSGLPWNSWKGVKGTALKRIFVFERLLCLPLRVLGKKRKLFETMLKCQVQLHLGFKHWALVHFAPTSSDRSLPESAYCT